MKVKICGMRTRADVECAARADAVGFVVASPKSPRNLTIDQARRLMDAVPEGTLRVLVTVENQRGPLLKLAEALVPDALQLHRGADPAAREAIQAAHPGVALWVAVDAAAPLPPEPWDALVVDARTRDGYGGTGRVTDWDAARRLRDAAHPRPLVLAGGLTPENVAAAAKAVRPAWVDVSTGVEGKNGKIPERVAAFIRAARDLEVNQ